MSWCRGDGLRSVRLVAKVSITCLNSPYCGFVYPLPIRHAWIMYGIVNSHFTASCIHSETRLDSFALKAPKKEEYQRMSHIGIVDTSPTQGDIINTIQKRICPALS